MPMYKLYWCSNTFPSISLEINHSSLFNSKLVQLNYLMSKDKLAIIKLVVKTLGISEVDLEKAEHLADVFYLMEQSFSDTALSLLIQILQHLKVDETRLQSLEQHIKKVVQLEDNRSTDFVLTVSCIMQELPEENYQSLRTLAYREFFDRHPSRTTSRIHLLKMLMK